MIRHASSQMADSRVLSVDQLVSAHRCAGLQLSVAGVFLHCRCDRRWYSDGFNTCQTVEQLAAKEKIKKMFNA